MYDFELNFSQKNIIKHNLSRQCQIIQIISVQKIIILIETTKCVANKCTFNLNA